MKVKFWMFRLLPFISWLMLALPTSAASTLASHEVAREVYLPASIIEIIDSQTLLVLLEKGEEICIILNGINTPLKLQAGYRRSVLGIIDLVQGDFRNQILIKPDRLLNAKSWLVSIYDQEQKVLGNLALIHYGYAWPDVYLSDDDEKNQQYLVDAKNALADAKANANGHWAGIHIGEPPLEPQQSYLSLLLSEGHSSEKCQPQKPAS